MDAYASAIPKPRKRALLIGINYTGKPGELSGCVNDIVDMRSVCAKLGYDEFCILFDGKWTGTSYPSDNRLSGGDQKPTRNNMIAAFRWLVGGAKKGDKLFFHYSGHGSKIRARIPGSEPSGYDSVLLPLDYEWSGVLRDDELRALLVDPLRGTGAALRVVLDCCHSGTGLDLRFNLCLTKPRSGPDTEENGSLQTVVARLTADLVKAELARWFGEKAVTMQLGNTESAEFTEWTDDGTESTITSDTIKSRTATGSGYAAVADIIAISGCGDLQTSADATFNARPNGALTHFLLAILSPAVSGGQWPFATTFLQNLHRQLQTNGYEQIPQLSSETPVSSATRFNLV